MEEHRESRATDVLGVGGKPCAAKNEMTPPKTPEEFLRRLLDSERLRCAQRTLLFSCHVAFLVSLVHDVW
jgi:hypothetical protein